MARTHVWWNTKGPRSTPKEVLTNGRVRIRQVRSGIGHSWRMRLTLEAIGLKHHQDEVILNDSPALRGQLKRVRHLVEVEALTDEPTAAGGEAAGTKKQTRKKKGSE